MNNTLNFINDCIDGDFLKHKANRISEIRNVKTNHACFMPDVGIFSMRQPFHTTKFFWATDAAVSQSFADFTGEIKKDDDFPESVFINRMEIHDKRLRYYELYGGRAYDEYFEVTQNE